MRSFTLVDVGGMSSVQLIHFHVHVDFSAVLSSSDLSVSQPFSLAQCVTKIYRYISSLYNLALIPAIGQLFHPENTTTI